MNQRILERFRDNGSTVHLLFSANESEIRWLNGRLVEIGGESSLFETFRGELIALRNEDIVRIEPFEKPRNDSWREVYRSNRVSADYEPEPQDGEHQGGDADA